MFSFKSYKQRVAPLYKTEHERRLFATASGDKAKKLKDELVRLLRLRLGAEEADGADKEAEARD